MPSPNGTVDVPPANALGQLRRAARDMRRDGFVSHHVGPYLLWVDTKNLGSSKWRWSVTVYLGWWAIGVAPWRGVIRYDDDVSVGVGISGTWRRRIGVATIGPRP